jgi:hypothetical protein
VKTKLLIPIICIIVNFAHAQTPIKDQPGKAYFEMLEKTIIEKTIPQEELKALRSSQMPDNFMDTLIKYDWVYLGGHVYSDKKDDGGNIMVKHEKYTKHSDMRRNYQILRFDKEGACQRFSINGYDFVIKSKNLTNAPNEYWNVIKMASSWHIEKKLSESTEFLKIILYNNGVLVYFKYETGKTTKNTVEFTDVYAAVPKGFTWSYKE